MMENTDRISILAAKLRIFDSGTARRLYIDVRSAAKIFQRPAKLRPSALLKNAKNFLVQLEARPNYVEKIPEELRPLLGVPEEFQEKELRGKPLELISEVKKACEMLENDLTVAHDQRGGRAPDSRIRQFAMTLAIIYERYSGKPPTFTIDKNDHGLSSPFTLFGEESFAQFCPSKLNSPGRVRLALQEAAQVSKELEEFDPKKVK